MRLFNVLEKQYENCKDIVCELMAAVKMKGANKVEFSAYIKNGRIFLEGNSFPINRQYQIPEFSMELK